MKGPGPCRAAALCPACRHRSTWPRVWREVERNALRARNGIKLAAGVNRPGVGLTPKDVVWQRERAQLWRYRNDRIMWSPPIFLVASLVNRSYVLDPLPGNSFIEQLRDAGFDVFLLDWGVARRPRCRPHAGGLRGRLLAGGPRAGVQGLRCPAAQPGRVLLRRGAGAAVGGPSPGTAGAQPRDDGHPGRLQPDALRRAVRYRRQLSCGRCGQRARHGDPAALPDPDADRGRGAVRRPARAPVERRLSRRVPGHDPLDQRPGAVPRRGRPPGQRDDRRGERDDAGGPPGWAATG